jgi:hypothetical protein
MPQHDRTRRTNNFLHNEEQKILKQKNAKSEICTQILSLGKRIAEAKTATIFSIRLEPAETFGPTPYRNPRHLWHLGLSRQISPLMRFPFMKGLSPSLPDTQSQQR